MNWRPRSWLPDWAVVVLVSGAVGAISAVAAIAAYREAVVLGDGPTSVPSESNDQTN